jgi:predicted DCC family thiol-disulfide oxidoreductase YuxK
MDHTSETFTVLIDGDCPLCRHEARLLRRLDGRRGRLSLEDIASPGFEAGRYGRTMDELMGSIHGVTGDGRVVTGMEVFRRAYGAVGLGWLLAPTGWPGLRLVFDAMYRVFARIRPHLPGRTAGCADGACRTFTRSEGSE